LALELELDLKYLRYLYFYPPVYFPIYP